jgi:hypothetical protein
VNLYHTAARRDIRIFGYSGYPREKGENSMIAIGTRVILKGKRNHMLNGKKGTIVGIETHGVTRVKYYRIEQIEGLHPSSSHMYKVNQVQEINYP